MTQRLIDPSFRAVGSDGVPLSGAKLFVYEAGTTTKTDTYSDSALSTVNSNPVVSNSAGLFADMFVAAGDYKVVYATSDATDPPTSSIDTWDDINIRADSSFSGGINVDGYTEHLVNAQTGTSYTYLTGDRAKLVTHSNANPIAGTLPQANSTTFSAGWYVLVHNKGAGTLTITPTTSTINGAATLVLETGQSVKIVSDGTNYQTQGFYGTLATQDADSVNIDGGAIDGTIVGANTAAAGTFTNLTASTDLTLASGATVTAILDEDNMASDSATALATQQSIKAYVDSALDIVLLDTQTASNSATVALATGIDSTYSSYIIKILDLIPQTDNTTVNMRTSTDSGSGYDSGAGNYAWSTFYREGGTTITTESAADTEIQLTGSTVAAGSGTGESLNFTITMYNPSGSAVYKNMEWTIGGYTETPAQVTGTGIGVRLATADVNAVQFFMSSGNIASGVFKLYGVR